MCHRQSHADGTADGAEVVSAIPQRLSGLSPEKR